MLGGGPLNGESLFDEVGLDSGTLNGSPLNTHPINGDSETAEPVPLIGSGLLISFEQEVAEGESGLLISFEQNVGLGGAGASGLLISFEQNVTIATIGSGLLISFEQNVRATSGVGGGRLISFEQNVYRIEVDPVPTPSHLLRTGWDATIILNGSVVDTCIGDTMQITRTEGGAAIASFTLVYMPGDGIQNVELLAGKPVTIDLHVAAGTFRVYTGVVDVPEIDLIEKKIKINCTDRRLELINSQLGPTIGSIGFYSNIIFSKPKDVAEELEQRLSTIPFAVDFDAFGNFTLTAKRAKAIPDFILPANTVYYRDPQVSYTSRGRITNRINIAFQYQYPRLHHMQKNFEWVSPIHDNICLLLGFGYTLAQKTMIAGGVYASGWPLRGDITYMDIHQGGWYQCSGQPVGWSTVQYTGTAQSWLTDDNGEPIVDENGDKIATTAYRKDINGDFITDTDGNKVADVRITGGTNYFPMFADGASWIATTRWAQTIIESYSLVVSAPQSITQYGIVESSNQYSSSDNTDASAWENYTVYDNPFNQTAPTYHIDAAAGRGAFNSAVVTALNIAKTTILNTHRDTNVNFNRFIWPQIDLKHTVELSTPILNARGKVITITHSLNMGTTEAFTHVELALSRSVGEQADSAFSVPTIPADTVDTGPTTITLGNHYGQDPDGPGGETWTGRVGNAYGANGLHTTYAEQFIVRTPPIDAALREDKAKSASAGYSVAIPNDLLEVIF